jgi:hypothetical protein
VAILARIGQTWKTIAILGYYINSRISGVNAYAACKI